MSAFLEHARGTELYRRLATAFPSDDGDLLERTDDKTAEAQTEFLRWALHLAVPSVILEAGTNKGMFTYLVSLVCHNVTIRTFDKDPRCARVIELINRAQQNAFAACECPRWSHDLIAATIIGLPQLPMKSRRTIVTALFIIVIAFALAR